MVIFSDKTVRFGQVSARRRDQAPCTFVTPVHGRIQASKSAAPGFIAHAGEQGARECDEVLDTDG
jgi:hypothetical protein